MNFKNLVEGQQVYLDAGFTCAKEGLHTVKKNAKSEFYFDCNDGEHLLDGQCNGTDQMVGVFAEKPNDK